MVVNSQTYLKESKIARGTSELCLLWSTSFFKDLRRDCSAVCSRKNLGDAMEWAA